MGSNYIIRVRSPKNYWELRELLFLTGFSKAGPCGPMESNLFVPTRNIKDDQTSEIPQQVEHGLKGVVRKLKGQRTRVRRKPLIVIES